MRGRARSDDIEAGSPDKGRWICQLSYQSLPHPDSEGIDRAHHVYIGIFTQTALSPSIHRAPSFTTPSVLSKV